MWRKREIIQLERAQLEIEMDNFLSRLLNNENINIDDIRELFLEQFPNEGLHMESYITDFLS